MFLYRLGRELGLPVYVVEQMPAAEIMEWRAYFSTISKQSSNPPRKPHASPEAEQLAWIKHLNI